MSTNGSARRTGERTEQFWARRNATAHTPKDRARMEWERLCAELAKFDPDQQDAAWRKVTDRLAVVRDGITSDQPRTRR